jgi:hypothetical protein
MNELENQLGELVKRAIEVAEKTGKFVVEQAPLLLQEFYMWHIAEAIIYIIIGLTIAISLFWISRLFGKEESFAARFFRYASYVTFTSYFIYNLHTILYIYVAPKLYLITYFMK